jgi:hypothetical protein
VERTAVTADIPEEDTREGADWFLLQGSN